MKQLKRFTLSPDGLCEVLDGMIGDKRLPVLRQAFKSIHERGTQGKAMPFLSHIGLGTRASLAISQIPGHTGADRYSLLLAFCFDEDNLTERLQETIEHAMVKGRGPTRKVVFVTSKWERHRIAEQIRAVRSLRNDGVRFSLVYCGSEGFESLTY